MYKSLKRACEKLRDGISRKSLLLILALTVTVATAAGGTLAFLYGTQEVKNTFTYGDVSIDLAETDTQLDEDDNPNTNDYPMYPGQSIHKDPTISVGAGSMDCWLYVEITQSTNFADYMAYAVAEGWLPLESNTPGEYVPGVYYRAVDASDTAQYYPVLEGNEVHMLEHVTLQMLATLTDADYPWLSIKAYAMQRDASIAETATALKAWALLANVQ